MYVILTYDIHSKRVGKGLKVCRKYLRHVQRSVFEGAITEKQLLRLQKELYDFLVPEQDSVCIYCMETVRFMRKRQFGLSNHQGLIV